MLDDMKIMIDWFKDYYADCIYLVFSIISAVYLINKNKKSYIKIVLPSALLYVLIFNPFLYRYVFSKIIYWRLFWMIPSSLFIILAVGEILRKSDKIRDKMLICIAVISLSVVLGTNVFEGAKRGEENNIYRLSKETVDIGSTMLEYDKNPRCIVSSGLISSIRLYSGDIEPMYGRNAQGYINRASDEVKTMYNVMESEAPDYDYVLTKARLLNYNFVVNVDTKPISESTLSIYGYEWIKSIDGYNIYYNEDISD